MQTCISVLSVNNHFDKEGWFIPHQICCWHAQIIRYQILLEASKRFHTNISDGCKLIQERVR
jgi:uncharacterized protein YjcR